MYDYLLAGTGHKYVCRTCKALVGMMRLERQPHSLPVSNHDLPTERGFQKHSALLEGGTKRVLIVGGSGCGKTNLMVSLLLHPNGLRFAHVYLYCKTLHQPKYNFLRRVLGSRLEEHDDKTDILHPKNAKTYSVIVFDDVVTDNQSVMRDYFSFGRHRHIDCFYLCQTYSAIPKQLIRDNANMIIVFRQDGTNLKHVYDDHVNTDMPFEQFKKVCSVCWKDAYGFLVIDKDGELHKGRYRKGMDVYISI